MKKSTFVLSLLLGLWLPLVHAQTAVKPTGATTATKPVSPNPGRAAANPKPATPAKAPAHEQMQAKMPKPVFTNEPAKAK